MLKHKLHLNLIGGGGKVTMCVCGGGGYHQND
jgi:hypothetical protein